VWEGVGGCFDDILPVAKFFLTNEAGTIELNDLLSAYFIMCRIINPSRFYDDEKNL
jgi:hypothetical protein